MSDSFQTTEYGLRCILLNAEHCALQLKSQFISNINCCDAFGNTALHLAAMNGRKQVVVVLLQAGIDATLHNARGVFHNFSGLPILSSLHLFPSYIVLSFFLNGALYPACNVDNMCIMNACVHIIAVPVLLKHGIALDAS